MKKKIIKPEDIIKPVDSSGKALLPEVDPAFLGTKPIYLSRTHPIKAVNMLLPPGISSFFVERLDKNHIRFLIRTGEIQRLAIKAEKMMGEPKKKKEVLN